MGKDFFQNVTKYIYIQYPKFVVSVEFTKIIQ